MFALTGCSNPDPVTESVDGTLAEGDALHRHDASFYDEYTFEAKAGWQIDVEMTSPDFDTYLQLYRAGDGEWLIENNDAVPGLLERGSRLTLRAPADGVYLIWANSDSPGETGAYHLSYSAQPAGE